MRKTKPERDPSLPPWKYKKYEFYFNSNGPVVQRWVSANPWLKFNPLFWFVYFCTSVYLKTLEKWNPINPDKILKKHFQIYRQAVRKFALNFKLT
jgi:hypothetical protein